MKGRCVRGSGQLFFHSPLPFREGPGVGVAEALGGFSKDSLCYAVKVFNHVAIPEAHYGPAVFNQKAGAPLIISVRAQML